MPQGAVSALLPPRRVWPLPLTLAPSAPRLLHTRWNRFVVKYQDSGKDSIWEAPSGRTMGPNGILFVVSVDPSPTLLSGERGSFPMGPGCQASPHSSLWCPWQGVNASVDVQCSVRSRVYGPAETPLLSSAEPCRPKRLF